MYAPPFVDTARSSNNSSIVSAEHYALLLALQRIQSHKSSKFSIFTDLLSSLQSLSSFKITHALVFQLLEFYNFLLSNDKTIVFCWIPSHMGIRGNAKIWLHCQNCFEF
ncbi:reverse transcriptase-like protein [Solemya velum gill symbiont]|uniref:reverse transcriptase-like protein n=1 Tax=Solemya velum gill symbiont TaxID=2340 RepID=UPI0018A86B1C